MDTVIHTDDSRDAASRRVRAYLRSAGIDDNHALERLAELILELAEQSPAGEPIEQAAMQLVLNRRDAWLTALTGHAAGKGHVPDPFAGWRLKMILRKQPQAFLAEPHSLGAELDTFEWPAVPEISESQMPAQELGKLPLPLRRSFWRQLSGSLLRYFGGA
jgi:hypothetical protein